MGTFAFQYLAVFTSSHHHMRVAVFFHLCSNAVPPEEAEETLPLSILEASEDEKNLESQGQKAQNGDDVFLFCFLSCVASFGMFFLPVLLSCCSLVGSFFFSSCTWIRRDG